MNEKQTGNGFNKAFTICLIIVVIVTMAISIVFNGFPDFSFHGYYEYAPDGEYHVLVYASQRYSDNTISFPIDTCCPTELHGSFRFSQNVTWSSDGWYRVKLRGNVIVDAWLV